MDLGSFVFLLLILFGCVLGYCFRIWQKRDSNLSDGNIEIDQIKSELASSKNEAKKLRGELEALKANSESKEATTIPFIDVAEEESLIEPKSGKASKFSLLKNENLQIIEGVGPKMESVLKENGLDNWQKLGSQSTSDLRIVFEKYGNKYKIIDPATWPEQAKLAANGAWPQLIRMQKGLDATNKIGDTDNPAKIEKVMIKLGIVKEYKQDDLKAIEGIGPKIAELLDRSGISSWKELAGSSQQTLQDILDKAGKRYQLADPSSWPKQAALADAGRFDELTDYQESLQGGV